LGEEFALNVKKTGFDRPSTAKSPEKVREAVNEFKLDDVSEAKSR
jgi:hypothetical protein